MLNMALRKDGNSRNSASYKPYDSSNSFVKKMTNSVAGVTKTVTGFLSWGSNSQSEREPFNDVLSANLEDERTAPAAKRMKVQSEEDKTLFEIISSSGKGLQETYSPIKPVNDIHAAGPSNRNKCIISSTPAFASHRSPIFSNTLDQSSSKRIAQNAEDSEVADISTTLPQFSVHQRHNITVPSLPKDVPNMMSTTDANKSLSGSFSSANSRRPSFNVDVFSSSSRRLSLSVCEGRNRNCLSPFYSARTMYGGASALLPYGSQTASRMRSASTSKLDVFSPRSQITMQPVPSPSKLNDQEILSASARRILDSLDKYCSPVADAKRIPVNESSRKSVESTPQPLNRGVKRKLPTLSQMLPSTSELLRIKRTEKMQDSVTSAKQTVSTVPESSIAAEDSDSSSDSAELDYSVLSQESKDTGSHYVGKLTRKNESKFDDRPKPVSLPNAVLKISNLPKFDVTDEFVFSKPLLLENLDEKSEECAAESVAKNNKSTQSPAAKSVTAASVSTSNAFPKDAKNTVLASFNATFSKTPTPTAKSSPTCRQTDDSSSSSSSSPASKFLSNDTASLKSSSSGGSPKTTNWTCMKCFTMNTVADECSKCSHPRPPKVESQPVPAKSFAAADKSADSAAEAPLLASGWGDKFKPAADTWECPECLVRNKNASAECVACGKAKNNVPKSGAVAANATGNTFDWKNLQKPGGWSGAAQADSKGAVGELAKELLKSDATAGKEPAKPQTFSFGVDKSGAAAPAFGQTNAFKFGAPDKAPAGSISFGTPNASVGSAPATFTFGVKSSSQPATGDHAVTVTSNGETGAVSCAPVASFAFGLSKAGASETSATTPMSKNPLLGPSPAFIPSFGGPEKPAAEKKEGSAIFNDVSSTSNSKNPLLTNDASVFKTPKFAAPKTAVAATAKENGDMSRSGNMSTGPSLFNVISSSTEAPKKKVALFSSVLGGEHGLAARSETPAVANGGANVVSSSNNAFVTSLSTSAFTPAPSKFAEAGLSFGAAAAASKAEAPAFGDKSGAAVKLFGAQTDSFGGSVTTTASATPLLFGNSLMGMAAGANALKSSDTTSSAASTFAPPPFQFGANASASAAAPLPLKPAAEMSVAGNAVPASFAAATQPPLFSFGANAAAAAPAAAPQPAGSGFMFNGPKAEDADASKFRFGAAHASPFGGAAVGAASPFAFGSAVAAGNVAESNERPPANMLFGGVAGKASAVEAAPVIANSIGGGFGGNVFGAQPSQSANPAKKSGGFCFNAAQPSFAAPTVNNFATLTNPNANQEPKPAFVFGSANPAPPQNHNFNMNIPSTFNFTAGANQMMSFSSQPSATNATPNACGQGRKIKKAVRRTTQQK